MTGPGVAPPLADVTTVPGLWDAATAALWLVAIGALDPAAIDIRVNTVGRALPPKPDHMVIITDTEGGPLEVNGDVDVVTFQLRFRGAPGDEFGPLREALAADKVIVRAPRIKINGVTVISVARHGGRPSLLGPHAGSAGRGAQFEVGLRAEATCTYLARVPM